MGSWIQPIDQGTALAVCDEAGPVISLYAPMRIEDEGEMDRIFPMFSEQLTVPGYLHEAVLASRAVELGLSLAERLAKVMGGDFFAVTSDDKSESEEGVATA